MTGPNGEVRVNTADLMVFGQKVVGKADEVKALGLGRAGSDVAMPQSATMCAAQESGAAREAVSGHVHERGSYAGAQIMLAADKYEHVEERSAHQLQNAVDPNIEHRW